LIVDNKNDLNVYTKAKEDGKSNRCCGQGSDKSCCEKSPSCCNNEESTPGDTVESFKSNFKDIDFNEWAGIYYHRAVFLVCELLTVYIGSFKVYAVKS